MTETDIPLLVNREHPLSDAFVPNLEVIDGMPELQCDRQCVHAITQFLAASKAAGFYPAIISAYRDQKTQMGCFGQTADRLWTNGMTLGEALAEAQRFVAAPETSEHQTGLAFDIKDAGYRGRDVGLENSPGQKWLMDHCHEFGFILRYPPDKENITHVAFEPCHFRYVGKYHAAEIVKRNLTLEEYIDTYDTIFADFADTSHSS